ncbi:hypothetical protein DM02DRAFT_648416 [Periconia macrospinosa]|uniref:Uncharacterized protein n=1 Tax=Periconia macrospinosa TaxID=97972 RepID=A0A2V1ECS1_9PLEO|nr:hypothetical protein DM02DRAFT_648416 [Periconia macrospinosa]
MPAILIFKLHVAKRNSGLNRDFTRDLCITACASTYLASNYGIGAALLGKPVVDTTQVYKDMRDMAAKYRDTPPPKPQVTAPVFTNIAPTQMVYANPSQPTAIKPMAGAQTGVFGAAMSRGEEYAQGDEDPLAVLPWNEKHALARMFKVVFFRDLRIDFEIVKALANPNTQGRNAMTLLHNERLQKMAKRLQKEMFASKAIHEFTFATIDSYNRNKLVGAPLFKDLHPGERRLVFGRNISDRSIIKQMLRPVQQAVDIPRVMADERFIPYIQDMLLTACASTYLSARYGDISAVLGKPVVDNAQVYRDMRIMAEKYSTTLPIYEQIPSPHDVDVTTIHARDGQADAQAPEEEPIFGRAQGIRRQ